MALIKCKECGNEVSTTAKSCPKCGAKITKPASKLGIFFALLVSFIFFKAIITNEPVPPAPTQTAEQKLAQNKQNAALQRATSGAIMLKNSMRNPDSFKLESALVINGTGAVCYDYRAQNGFGGINAEHAVLSGDGKQFKTSSTEGFSKLWNVECAGKNGQEAAAGIRWAAL